jgi:uncharacterized protein (DUF1501 family)
MSITRRTFVRAGGLAAIGTAVVPTFLRRVYEPLGAKNKRLVVIFQRGAADGLNIVVPHGERSYYAMRPSINIPRGAVIDLDGFFGLHPSLSPFHPLWRLRHLAIIHAAGSPNPTRSHFAAQDFMESGTPGVRATEDGWLNRALNSSPQPSLAGSTGQLACRAVASGPSLPRILSGTGGAVAVNGLSDQTLGVVKMLKSAATAKYKPAPGAAYPNRHFADSLRQLAQLIKVNPGVQIAFADIGGWDHHVNEGGTQGQLANRLHEFSQALAAFWADLGDVAEHTVIVTMSEFGRSARENENRGTDHGHANVIFVLGGPVKGGKVYGRWPGLDQSQLYEGRDLAVTTDFRQVLGEAVYKHLGNKSLDQVFPGFENQPGSFLNYLE